MNTSKICPASFIMIGFILLSCFAFLFSTSQIQQIAATIICGIGTLVFAGLQWVESANPNK